MEDTVNRSITELMGMDATIDKLEDDVMLVRKECSETEDLFYDAVSTLAELCGEEVALNFLITNVAKNPDRSRIATAFLNRDCSHHRLPENILWELSCWIPPRETA